MSKGPKIHEMLDYDLERWVERAAKELQALRGPHGPSTAVAIEEVRMYLQLRIALARTKEAK